MLTDVSHLEDNQSENKAYRTEYCFIPGIVVVCMQARLISGQ